MSRSPSSTANTFLLPSRRLPFSACVANSVHAVVQAENATLDQPVEDVSVIAAHLPVLRPHPGVAVHGVQHRLLAPSQLLLVHRRRLRYALRPQIASWVTIAPNRPPTRNSAQLTTLPISSTP